MDIQEITPAQVLKAYSGRKGCMCGCIGTYYYNPLFQQEGGKDRGYPVRAEECDPKMVVKILRTIQGVESVNVELDGEILSAEIGKRSYVVYLIKK